MNIYLAAKYSRHPEMRKIRDHIEASGHKVTSRWINGQHGTSVENAIAAQRRLAIEDWSDLHNSHVMFWFSEPDGAEAQTGGRHVEFGLAIAWGTRIIVIGRKENVFHYLPEVTHVPDLAAALQALAKKAPA